MPVSLSALRAKVRSVPIPFEDLTEGESLTVSYHPHLFNGAFLTRLSSDQISTHQALSELLCDWDLQDESGNTLPICVETLDMLPHALLLLIWESIKEDVFPGNSENRETD